MPDGPNRSRLWPLASTCWWKPEPALLTDQQFVEFAELVPAKLDAIGHLPLSSEHTSAAARP